MANIAFDKHVLFCEKYIAGVNGALDTLFRRGPHEDVLKDADTLFNLRRNWVLWLTPEIEAGLVNFEGALRKIGANAWLLESFGLPRWTDTVQRSIRHVRCRNGKGDVEG